MTIEEKCTYVLKQTFLKSGLTEEKVAEKLGVTRRTVNNWVNGKSFPTFPQLIRWFNVLKIKMVPWIMKMYYVSDQEVRNKNLSVEQIEKDLTDYLNSLTPEQKKRALYERQKKTLADFLERIRELVYKYFWRICRHIK